MKKVAILLVFLLVVSMPLQAYAATLSPYLSFSGTTAKCDAVIVGNTASEHLEVTLKLMYGNRIIASWTSEGYGYVTMSQTATVNTGRTYKLVVEVFECGKTHNPVYVTGTC